MVLLQPASDKKNCCASLLQVKCSHVNLPPPMHTVSRAHDTISVLMFMLASFQRLLAVELGDREIHMGLNKYSL